MLRRQSGEKHSWMESPGPQSPGERSREPRAQPREPLGPKPILHGPYPSYRQGQPWSSRVLGKRSRSQWAASPTLPCSAAQDLGVLHLSLLPVPHARCQRVSQREIVHSEGSIQRSPAWWVIMRNWTCYHGFRKSLITPGHKAPTVKGGEESHWRGLRKEVTLGWRMELSFECV